VTTGAPSPRAKESERQRQAAEAPPPDVLTPADRYQELFVAVQDGGVFPDSKTFVDCAPLEEPAAILAAYRAQRVDPAFDLGMFVRQRFVTEPPPSRSYESPPGQALAAHIEDLWPVLTRQPRAHPRHASLLQLPRPYVVPGGRFRELYYWDAYFTMLGLACAGQRELMRDMLDDFTFLIDTYGHVPNGTRTYYLSRSQPPLFAMMVELAARHGVVQAVDYLPQLMQEHAYWMRGLEDVGPGEATRRVVRLRSGEMLNRYWDDRDTPREESWLEDVTTVECCDRPPAAVYRDLRAACESGWDFSTRWLHEVDRARVPSGPPRGRAASAPSLTSICTTDIVPVDLNAFLYQLERTISELAGSAGDAATQRAFAASSRSRRDAVIKLCWDERKLAFVDHDWRRAVGRRCLTAACVAPLWVGLASSSQARALAGTVAQRLVAPGGLSTTETWSDQQWDRPNGWAPPQWMAVQGFLRYGESGLARRIATRWLATVAAVYERDGKLVEKYALRSLEGDDSAGGRGGEYPLQDGFGWTNGVSHALLKQYPEHTAWRCVARAALPLHK
jgi:alpha,alpha-trehalase